MSKGNKKKDNETPEDKKERHHKYLEKLAKYGRYDDDIKYEETFGLTEQERDREREEYIRRCEQKYGKVVSNYNLAQNKNKTKKQQAHKDKAKPTNNTKGNGTEGNTSDDEEWPLIETASEAILAKYSFMTIEETGEVWYYEKGVYSPGGEILIAKEVEDMFGYELTKGKLSEITAHIMRRTYHKQEELDADNNIINLKNGLYDIENNKLLKHTPRYLSVNQKAITYVKGAKPERFGKFLSEVFYPTDIRTAVDAMAYTFYRDYDEEVIFVLLGYGRNGKTVYTSIITILHGRVNVSNVPLTQLLTNRFACWD